MSVALAAASAVADKTVVPRVAIAGGGTGGHVNPALAIADAWRQSWPSAELLFIGTARGLEATLVPKRGYPIELVEGSRLVGGGPLAKLRGLWALLRGILQARRLLREHRIGLVIGVGGYASGAALLAAWTMGLRTAIHESNAVPGFTNKVLGRIVNRVFLGFEAATDAFPAGRVMVSGNPVRAEIVALQSTNRAPIVDGRPAQLLVVGGSQGALFLNERVPELLGHVASAGVALRVCHQVGKRDGEPVRAAYEALGIEAEVVSYIDDMSAAYENADFAITRSGSGTVAELAAAGLPALLVPFPWAAGDHQAANASAFADAGGGLLCRQEDWEGQKLAQRIVSLLTDNQALEDAAAGARSVSRADAAQAVVRDCEAMMEGRW